MYGLMRDVPLRRLAVHQLPPLIAAFVIAELFYKFHSFTLECAAFLVTWFALDLLFTMVGGRTSHMARSV